MTKIGWRKGVPPVRKKTWDDLLWWTSSEWADLKALLDNAIEGRDFVPEKKKLYRALFLTPLDKVKVVILGQDPYHTPGVADGLAFSTQEKMTPPSLNNIFKEYVNDLGFMRPTKNDLTPWAKQGVLLLNTRLTTAPGEANAHKGMNWEIFTQQVIDLVNEVNPDTVFIAWGEDALATIEEQLVAPIILSSSHPSPYAARKGIRPFLGSRPFTRCNEILKQSGKKPIDWYIE